MRCGDGHVSSISHVQWWQNARAVPGLVSVISKQRFQCLARVWLHFGQVVRLLPGLGGVMPDHIMAVRMSGVI